MTLLTPQQSRSISWTGWWSSKPDPPTATTPSNPTLETTPSRILEIKEPVKASYGTADTPELSGSHGLAADQTKPDVLERIEDTFLAPPEGVAEATDISQVPERIGYLTEVCGLEYWYGPTATLQWIMEHVHIWGALPWSVTILSVGLLTRLAVLPYTIKAQKMGARMREIQPYVAPLKEEYRQAMARSDKQEMMRVGSEMRQLQRESGIKTFDGFKPLLIQIPLTFGGFRVLRNASELPVPSMESEGFLWLDSLVVGDPWIIPIIIGGMTYRTMSQSIAQAGNAGGAASFMVVFKYILPFVSIGFTHFQPLAAQLWFFTMTLVSQVQIGLFNNQKFRDYFGMGAKVKPQLTQPPPTDAFGYRMDTQVGPMHVRNRGEVIDVKPKPQVEETSQPRQNVSFIDKAVDTAKDRFSTQTKDIRELWKTRRVEQKSTLTQRQLDDYETQAQEELSRRSNEMQYRSGGNSKYVERQVGNMKTRSKRP